MRVQVMGGPEVYFHAGMPKAASTWLQYSVFPKLEGVRYIQRTRFRRSPRIIGRGGAERFLVSRELHHEEMPRAVRWFSASYPQAHPILVLRRHDSWLASVYRRAIKNARYVPFASFVDLEGDRGVRKQASVRFQPRIRMLEDHFAHKPLLLFYDDLQAAPNAFLDTLVAYIGATYDRDRVSLRPRHRSYDEKQLKVMRALARRLPGRARRPSENLSSNRVLRRAQLFGVHVMLYGAHAVPRRWLDDDPLVRPEQLDRVREFFAEDWDACLNYAAENNPTWDPLTARRSRA